jgi:hypothetical protein
MSIFAISRTCFRQFSISADLDVMISAIVNELAPDLISGKAIGYESAAQLLITAGDNPERLKSEAGFAALCDVNPSSLIRQNQQT